MYKREHMFDSGIPNKNEFSEVKWVEVEAANQLMPYHPGGVLSLLNDSVPYLFRNSKELHTSMLSG